MRFFAGVCPGASGINRIGSKIICTQTDCGNLFHRATEPVIRNGCRNASKQLHAALKVVIISAYGEGLTSAE